MLGPLEGPFIATRSTSSGFASGIRVETASEIDPGVNFDRQRAISHQTQSCMCNCKSKSYDCLMESNDEIL